MAASCGCGDCFRNVEATVTEHTHSRPVTVRPIVLECRLCDRVFVNESTLQSHLVSKAHKKCELEGQNPFSVHPLPNLRIARCPECKLSFMDADALRQHRLINPLHLPSFCQQCQKWFKDEFALKQHLQGSPKHRKVVYISVATGNTLHKCFICGKNFKTEHALKDHTASPVHRPRTISCFSCTSKFKTPSGVAHHVESSCKQLSVNRHQITAAIQALEIEPAISIRPLIAGSTAAGSRPLIAYRATESSFNGKGYQCHLCTKTLPSLAGLNAHLNSPAHDEAEFKCPKCKRQFTLISGLVQHLESGACGLSNINDAEQRFKSMTDQISRTLTL